MARQTVTEESPTFQRALAAARHGSLEALGYMFEACRRWLLTVAAKELQADRISKTTPADIVQDTFLEAQRDFRRFQGRHRRELLNWLRRILLHNLADVRRRYATRIRDVSLERPLGNVHELMPLAANESSPSEQIVAEEQATQVQAALANLP